MAGSPSTFPTSSTVSASCPTTKSRPHRLVRVLDLLPEHVMEPHYCWLDLDSTSRNCSCARSPLGLLDGLADWEPDFVAHGVSIFRNMLPGAAITGMTGMSPGFASTVPPTPPVPTAWFVLKTR